MSRLTYPPKNINNSPANPFVIQNLTVTGNASIAGNLSAGATSLSTLSAGGTAQLNNANIAGATSIGGALSVTGSSTLASISNTTITSSGLGTFNSLSVTNNATITGTGTAATLYETQAIVTATQANYLVTSTDRVVKLVTTGAGGPFTITFPNITTRNRVTIVMTGFNTATFTTGVLISGSTFTWAAIGDVATFVNLGSGEWYLDGAGISNAP